MEKRSFQWGQKKVFINMLTACNNERFAVTIEVKILAFPKREEGGSEHAKI